MDRTDSGADTALKTRVHEFIYNFHQGSEYLQGVGWDGGSKAPRDEGKGIHTHLLQQSHVHTSSAHTHSSSATHTFLPLTLQLTLPHSGISSQTGPGPFSIYRNEY